jgi:DNA-binding CsgD family transcriptional regulator
VVIGRSAEQERIAAVLADAREGRSGVLVLRGEAGIGKTTLLRAAEEQADGMTVLRSTGIESEHDLPYAALHQLVRSHLTLLERLPEPQAAALRGAFGLSFDAVEDRFLISLGLLSLLAELAEESPVLCLVDDAQWLDGPSAGALLFAARRLEAEAVAMLVGAREGDARRFDGPGLPEITLGPLEDDQARGLASTRAEAGDAESLVRTAAGNPLALLQLPVGRDEPGSVEDAFRERIAALPDPARRMLLLAAADEVNEVDRLDAAAKKLGLSIEDLGPAVDDGLVSVADTVTFDHPLIRAAAYGAARPSERRDAHEAFASVLEDEQDEVRRIWHLAGAVEGPDEEVAAQLEEAARKSVARGGHAAAASAFERAAELSEDEALRGHRLQLAARGAINAGRSKDALALAERARPLVADPEDHVGVQLIYATVEGQSGTPEEAHAIYMQAAEDTIEHDPGLATALVFQAIVAAVLGGWTERAFLAGRELISSFESGGTPEEEFMRAYVEGVPALAQFEPELAHERLTQALKHAGGFDDYRFLMWAGGVHMYLGDPVRGRVLYRRAVDVARATGSFSGLPWALFLATNADLGTKMADVESNATEGLEIARQTGQDNLASVFLAFLARVAAYQDREEDCRKLAEESLSHALSHNIGAAVSIARTALAEIGDGDAARAQLEYVARDTAQVSMLVIALPELVDACVRSGTPEAPREALAVYEVYATQAQGTTGKGILARCRGMVAEEAADKQRFFQEAIGFHARGTPPLERAKTQTVYGEFLRRARRRTEAREQLRPALATFEELGAALWARRAREELQATGETARKRDESTRDDLTPQELRIAQRVATGATNRDVAAQLFISPKTVEYHLGKVFMKLGIKNRMELARMDLGGSELAA